MFKWLKRWRGHKVRSDALLVCPFCGQLPQIEKLAGFDCVRHVNTECPISPVIGWSLCVWQERHTNAQGDSLPPRKENHGH